MRKSWQCAIGLVLAACLMAWPAGTRAQGQSQSQGSTPAQQGTSGQPAQQQGQQGASGQAGQTTQQQGQQGGTQDPNATQGTGGIPVKQAPPPPPPPDDTTPPAAAPAAKQPGSDAPIQQQQTVHPKNANEDVDAIGNRNPGKGLDFYSLEREIALGKSLAQEVERSSKLIDDPVVTEYVNRVGQNLVRNSDARVPFTIKVIDSDVVNAFALPGGFFYVNSGLILRAEEESELAGVMAHEMSHVIARHGTKNATKADIMQIGAMAAMIFIPYGWAGYGIYEGMNLAIPLTFLKFSRDDERQADFLGIQYMYKAGYDPNAYVTFFERLQADEKRRPGTISKVFSTHPPTPDRIEAAQKEIARILPERDEYIVTTSEFDSVKSRLRNIMFARKAQPGPGKPTLRTKTEQSDKTGTQDPSSSDDDRPTLKRRPDTP
ncbi:MAG TPA: M48 family metallopeptidase [Candidatus Acidoferrum sp.]|nr:M48 family metallopeptidase [Candidatus Acidoferrum sp.]